MHSLPSKRQSSRPYWPSNRAHETAAARHALAKPDQIFTARTLARIPDGIRPTWPLHGGGGHLCSLTAVASVPSSCLDQVAIPSSNLVRPGDGSNLDRSGLLAIGRRSGAHVKSAITFTFWRLGKIETLDTLFYLAAQFVGGISGVVFLAFLFGDAFRRSPVRYVATQPGPKGVWWALAAEFLMSFLLMSTILSVTNRPTLAKYTGYFTGFQSQYFLRLRLRSRG